MNTEKQVSHKSQSEIQPNKGCNLSRRKAVKLGIYAAYTAPILLSLLSSKKAHAIGSLIDDDGD